jgi:hypothetical protein
MMSRRDVLVLRAAALWTIWIWGTRIWNIVTDEGRSVGFKVTHVLLALISVAFAVAIWLVANRARARASAERGGHQRADIGTSS